MNEGEPRAVPIAFVMEQHLGHQTYYENLRAHVDTAAVAPTWIPVDYGIGPQLSRVPLPTSWKSAVAARSAVRTGLRDRSADAVVFNTQVPAALGGRLARSQPYVVITDVTPKQYDAVAEGYGHHADRPGPLQWLKYRVNRRTFNDAHACVGWSRWVCDSLVGDYGVPNDRTHVVPPGVDIDVWHPGTNSDDSKFRLLFVGGDFRRKGGHDLLRAFASLPDDSELTIVTRSDVPRVDRVRVVDDLEPNDPRLVELYQSSDVFVFPTRAETFGIAAVEAAASGLPIVATRVGGLSDIVIDGVSGYTFAPGDQRALGEALNTLHDEPEHRRRLAFASRDHAERRFDATANASRLVELVIDAARTAHE